MWQHARPRRWMCRQRPSGTRPPLARIRQQAQGFRDIQAGFSSNPHKSGQRRESPRGLPRVAGLRHRGRVPLVRNDLRRGDGAAAARHADGAGLLAPGPRLPALGVGDGRDTGGGTAAVSTRDDISSSGFGSLLLVQHAEDISEGAPVVALNRAGISRSLCRGPRWSCKVLNTYTWQRKPKAIDKVCVFLSTKHQYI